MNLKPFQNDPMFTGTKFDGAQIYARPHAVTAMIHDESMSPVTRQ